MANKTENDDVLKKDDGADSMQGKKNLPKRAVKKNVQQKDKKDLKKSNAADLENVDRKKDKKDLKKSNVADLKKKSKEKRSKKSALKDYNKTTFLKKEEVDKKWVVIDASGVALGRVAALAASMLRGKHKVDFTPNVDCGDNVIIINCKDAVLTGKKLEKKVRYRHSGWIGGLKQIRYIELMKNRPDIAMSLAVKGMLAGNKLASKMATHLRTYIGQEHRHLAQKPQLIEIKRKG